MIYAVCMRWALSAVAVALAPSLMGCGSLLFGDSENDDDDSPVAPSNSDGGDAKSESCIDGIDNDGNGLIDCADPACKSAGYTCSIGAPEGWEEVEIHRVPWQATPAAAPPCADAEHWVAGPIHDQASCPDCSCGLSQYCDTTLECSLGVTCSPVTAQGPVLLMPNVCMKRPSTAEPISCALHIDIPPDNQLCVPTTTGAALIEAPWSEDVFLCKHGGAATALPASSGCADSTHTCTLAAGANGPGPAACIRSTTAAAKTCPVEYPTQVDLYKAGGADTRSCTACSCAPLASGSSTCGAAAANASSVIFCQGGTTAMLRDNTGCVDMGTIGTQTEWSIGLDDPPDLTTAATCAPSGGATGVVDRERAPSVCCR